MSLRWINNFFISDDPYKLCYFPETDFTLNNKLTKMRECPGDASMAAASAPAPLPLLQMTLKNSAITQKQTLPQNKNSPV
jgi:hypothetical protein